MRELDLADNMDKPLLPVWHSGPWPPPAVAIFFAGMQRLPGGDLTHGYARAGVPMEDVAAQVAAALQRVAS
jgi:hypothetical protein